MNVNKLAFLACLLFATSHSGDDELPPPEKVAEYTKQGKSGLFFVTITGSKEFNGLADFMPRIQNPNTLEWLSLPRTIVQLGENKGTGFLGATWHPQFNQVCRYEFGVKLAGDGQCLATITHGGALLKIVNKLLPDQIINFTIFFYESHLQNPKLSQSLWQLLVKQDEYDAFLDKRVVKETKSYLPRAENDRLWLRLKQQELSIFSAANATAMRDKEKPDFVFGNVISIEIKRVDPCPPSPHKGSPQGEFFCTMNPCATTSGWPSGLRQSGTPTLPM